MEKIDRGLIRLDALSHFQESALTEPIYELFVKEFGKTDFIKQYIVQDPENPSASNQFVADSPITINTTLFEVLHIINEKEKKNVRGRQSITFKIDEKKHKCYFEKITVQDLLASDNYKRCLPLKNNLPHQILLNLILNEHLLYNIGGDVDALIKCLNQLKVVRNDLSHKGAFSKDDYDKEFTKLETETKKLYNHLRDRYGHDLRYQPEDLNCKIEECKQLAGYAEKKSRDIFQELRNEIHSKNKSLVSSKKTEVSEKVKNLAHFIENVTPVKPILLCGPRFSGKSLILKNLSCTLQVQDRLIMYLHDVPLKDNLDKDKFWEKIYNCVKSLMPEAVNRYGLYHVKAVLMVHMNQVVFLVDWRLTDVSQLCTEMKEGKWVISFMQNFHSQYEGWVEEEEGSWGMDKSWYVRNVEPYDYQAHVLHDFNDRFKQITEDEMIRDYKEEFIIHLGKIAFKNKSELLSGYSEIELNEVQPVPERFLYKIQSGVYKFIYPVVEDFCIAKFIVDFEQPNDIWLNNAKSIKLAFAFACAIWCQNKKVMLKNIHHIKSYLSNLYNKRDSFSYDDDDSFSDWNYLLQVDEACQGFRECRQIFADRLSSFQGWILRTEELTEGRLSRIKKILSKVKLNARMYIQLEDKGDISMLLNIWNELKSIKNLHQHCEVIIRINTGDNLKDSKPYEKLYDAISSSVFKSNHPLLLKEITGPFVCSRICDFYLCSCVKKLEKVNVSVYDLDSFKEVLALDKLGSVKNMSVKLCVDQDQIDNYLELNRPKLLQLSFNEGCETSSTHGNKRPKVK